MPPFADAQHHFDWVADHDAGVRKKQRAFHRQLLEFHRRKIPPGNSVLECGCGVGNLLRGVQPSRGVGLDLSSKMVEKARELHHDLPNLKFERGDVLQPSIDEQFDYIVCSYLIGYVADVEKALRVLRGFAHPRTRLVLTSLNNLWLWPLKWAQAVGFVSPQPESNWLSMADLRNLLELAGWEIIETGSEQLLPFDLPLVSPLLNRFVVKLPFFRHFGVTLTIVARPRAVPLLAGPVSCSVIVPARNEAGNISAAIQRIPVLGKRTEIIFVEGNSSDQTWEVIQREVAAYHGPHSLKAVQQPGRGKWDAVKCGFALAEGDVIVVQDADLTAPPEDLPKFFAAIAEGTTEFANGCRLVYPMEKQAMQLLNFFGNKFFAVALSYVLGQPLKDSLCGTKMMLRRDYYRIIQRTAEFGEFDPFGDFQLLFGAALLNLRIRDIPVRYKDRTYGTTNISRFSHGWLLLRMTCFALFRIKFAH